MAPPPSSTSSDMSANPHDISYIRGVNLGGWLVLERYISPYQFAVTDCHLRGDFCWYPGAISAPSSLDPVYKQCDLDKCKPVKILNSYNKTDYPIDERTLIEVFRQANETDPKLRKDYAEQWFNFHFENFIQPKDLIKLKQAGITHVRVPLPHWIMGDLVLEEPWLVGKRWESFVRVAKWCREIGLEVWPDIHTAPGSQNGFDNSGQSLPYTTCNVWMDNPHNVKRSLRAIRDIARGVVEAEIQDVVTGIGLLNEPFADCNVTKYNEFIDHGLDIVRETLGPNTAVYVSDMFQAINFNDGTWWLDPGRYNNTYLDSHYYQVFSESTRALSPRQHIAVTCENHRRRATSCCYSDAPNNNMPSQGVSRMVGEWSASFDILPNSRIREIMDGIAENGTAPFFDRELSDERKDFLKKFVQAQMVTWEAVDVGTASAWFYWTAKVEGGAFAEWSFLRGVQDGWFPVLPKPDEPSESFFGTCEEILFRTNDDMSIVHEFPDPTKEWTESSFTVDDDVVLSHGESIRKQTLHRNKHSSGVVKVNTDQGNETIHFLQRWQLPLGALILVLVFLGARFMKQACKRSKYNRIETQEVSTISV